MMLQDHTAVGGFKVVNGVSGCCIPGHSGLQLCPQCEKNDYHHPCAINGMGEPAVGETGVTKRCILCAVLNDVKESEARKNKAASLLQDVRMRVRVRVRVCVCACACVCVCVCVWVVHVRAPLMGLKGVCGRVNRCPSP